MAREIEKVNQEMQPTDEHKMSLSAQDVKNQVQRIQEVMAAVMTEGEHYGKIPGCGPKPTLLKAGAEKLASTFRLAPDYPPQDVIATETDDFISYRVRCALSHILTGQFVGAGVGACNSRERKYRNNQPWDIQNTLIKMACKRALVAAVLNATAASDIFAQDLEDDAPSQSSKQAQPIAQPQRRSTGTGNSNLISDVQRNRFYTIYKNAGFTDDQAKDYLIQNYGIEHSKDIQWKDYETICAYFQNGGGMNDEPGANG